MSLLAVLPDISLVNVLARPIWHISVTDCTKLSSSNAQYVVLLRHRCFSRLILFHNADPRADLIFPVFFVPSLSSPVEDLKLKHSCSSNAVFLGVACDT